MSSSLQVDNISGYQIYLDINQLELFSMNIRNSPRSMAIEILVGIAAWHQQDYSGADGEGLLSFSMIIRSFLASARYRRLLTIVQGRTRSSQPLNVASKNPLMLTDRQLRFNGPGSPDCEPTRSQFRDGAAEQPDT